MPRIVADVWGVSHYDIKSFFTEHPLGVEVGGGGVLIVGVPGGEGVGAVAAPAVGFEFGGDLFAELFVLFSVFVFCFLFSGFSQ